MAEDMGTDLGSEAGLAGVLADELPQTLAGEGLAPPRQEELVTLP